MFVNSSLQSDLFEDVAAAEQFLHYCLRYGEGFLQI